MKKLSKMLGVAMMGGLLLAIAAMVIPHQTVRTQYAISGGEGEENPWDFPETVI